MPAPQMLFEPAPLPVQVAVYDGRPADVRVVEHRRNRARVVVAVALRIFSVWFGIHAQAAVLRSGCPNWLTISAATPTACGEAIDVPCRYW